MKKLIILLLLGFIIASTFVGCNTNDNAMNMETEEEMRARIKKELEQEVEKKAEQKLEQEISQEKDNKTNSKIPKKESDTTKNPSSSNKNETKDNNQTAQDDPYKYLTGTEYSLDLNKDGQQDIIMFYNNEEEISMKVNGVKYPVDSFFTAMFYDKFRVVDIDTSDNYMEIMLRELEPPLDKRLVFYRYNGKELYNIGSIVIENYFGREENEMSTDGNGEITVVAYSNIMDEGIYYKKYRADKTGEIELIPQKGIYTYTTPIKSKVNKKIRGYNEKTTEKSYVEIAPGEEIVICGEIDKWLKIKWKDKELWITDNELTHFHPDGNSNFEFDGIRFWS